MMFVIKNGKVFFEGKLVEKNILIKDDKIFDITGSLPEDDQVDSVIDAEGKIILPGMIDAHVHFREPGYEHKEGFLSGSKAAAKGGVTTFFDMPNTKPATTTVKELENKRKLAKKSIVNYGFHFGANHHNINEIKKAKNVASTKVYMDITTGNMLLEDDDTLERIFRASKQVTVHAEGKNITTAINLAKKTKKRLIIAHISSKEEIERVPKSAKNVFLEVAPHHLFLTDEDASLMVQMKPMLKTDNDRDFIWKSINNGFIDTIGTDHAPHLKKEKESYECYGVPGVEMALPLMLNAVNRGKIKLARVVELCSENPAKIFNVKNRGQIKKGYFADLVIVDMEKTETVRNEDQVTKCGWTPFEGHELTGWPVTTIVNGRIVFDSGKFFNVKGREVEFNECR